MRTRLSLLLIACLCALAACVAIMRMAWAIVTAPPRAWRLAVAFDQLANAAANGHPDETISSRAARAELQGRRWGCVLCRLLDEIDPGHCAKALETRFLR